MIRNLRSRYNSHINLTKNLNFFLKSVALSLIGHDTALWITYFMRLPTIERLTPTISVKSYMN